MRRITLLTFTAILLAACASSQHETVPIRYFDFGPEPVRGVLKISAVLQVANISAPEWLETTGIPYRLAYDQPQAVYTYASSRWVAPPNVLLTNRLNTVLAEGGGVVSSTDAIRTGCALRIAIEDFSQTFDSAQTSHAVVRARATLSTNDGRALLAQKSFSASYPASADIGGAVASLGKGGDELIAGVVTWLAGTFDKATPQGQAAIKQCRAGSAG